MASCNKQNYLQQVWLPNLPGLRLVHQSSLKRIGRPVRALHLLHQATCNYWWGSVTDEGLVVSSSHLSYDPWEKWRHWQLPGRGRAEGGLTVLARVHRGGWEEEAYGLMGELTLREATILWWSHMSASLFWYRSNIFQVVWVISTLFSHFSLPFLFSVPFQVSVHSGRLCAEGEPGAADAQFWVLLAGVILSHTGPLINGPLW